MPITKEQEQVQAINTNIGMQPTQIKGNVYQFESMQKLSSQLNDFGSKIFNEFGHQYGYEKAQQHIAEEIEKGANGDFNNTNAIMSLTPVGAEYNKIMTEGRNTIIPTHINYLIQEHYNNVLNNPDIDIQHKVQSYSSAMNKLIQDQGINNLEPSVQNIIKLQIGDNFTKMASAQTKLLEKSQMASMIDGVQIDITNGINSKDIAVANNNLALGLQKIDLAQRSNLIDPVKAGEMKSDLKVRMISGYASNNNYTIDQMKEFGLERGLNSDEIEKINYKITSDFNRKQTQIQAQQLQSGFNYEQNRANSIINGQMMPMINYTAEQNTNNKNNFIAHTLYNRASTVATDEERIALLSSAEYQGLDSQAKTIINSNIGRIQRAKTRGIDLSIYGITHDTPYAQRRVLAPDLEPNKLFFNDETQAIKENLSADINSVKNIIKMSDNWGADKNKLLNYFWKGTSSYSDGAGDSRVLEDNSFIDGKFATVKPTGSINTNKDFMNEQTKLLDILKNSGLSEENANKQARVILDHIENVAKSRGTYKDSIELLKDRYKYNNNYILHKGDEDKLNENNYSNLYDMMSSNKDIKNRFKTKQDFNKFMNNSIIVPDSQTNSYYVGTKDGEALYIPYQVIDILPYAPNKSSIIGTIGKVVGNVLSIYQQKNEILENLVFGEKNNE